MRITKLNAFVGVVFLAVAAFYYWLNWSSEIPVLGGDHAVYLLAADLMSPFFNLGRDVAQAAMSYAYFPPLYPLILGIANGTSAHIEIAHAVTVSFLVAALVWYFIWAQQETLSTIQAFLLSVIFAFLPTTFLQSFGILSENLYLLLTLVAIWLLAKPDVSMPRLYAASAIIGLAAITRTIGVTLILALAVHLFLHERNRWRWPLFVSLVPILIWSLLKWLLDYMGGYLWIVTRILESESLYDFLLRQIITECHALWIGWIISFDHFPSVMTLIVGSVLGLICLAGTAYRIYRKKFDGIYLALFFGILVLWPFSQPTDARRLLYVAMPILLLHGLEFTHHLIRRFPAVKASIDGYAYLIIIVLITFPAMGLIFHRLVLAMDVSNNEYANSLYWYSGGDLNRARTKIMAYRELIASWKKVSGAVPVGECVYDVDPTWLMLYANRPSYTPPLTSTKNQFLGEATRCHYFFVASYSRVPYQLFYPRNYLMDEGRVIFADRMQETGGKPILAMLIEMPTGKFHLK